MPYLHLEFADLLLMSPGGQGDRHEQLESPLPHGSREHSLSGPSYPKPHPTLLCVSLTCMGLRDQLQEGLTWDEVSQPLIDPCTYAEIYICIGTACAYMYTLIHVRISTSLHTHRYRHTNTYTHTQLFPLGCQFS